MQRSHCSRNSPLVSDWNLILITDCEIYYPAQIRFVANPSCCDTEIKFDCMKCYRPNLIIELITCERQKRFSYHMGQKKGYPKKLISNRRTTNNIYKQSIFRSKDYNYYKIKYLLILVDRKPETNDKDEIRNHC